MPGKFSVTLILIVLAVVSLCAWAPWISRAYAAGRAVDSFNQAWLSVVDGCGTSCKGCGAVAARRVPFGVIVTIDYACGMIPADLPQYHLQSEVFVSAFATAHGFPRP